ncbi:type II toxin-antitoxin system RelE/ParE family toxin [Agromyces sp. NPDC056965]|uniref:type II toxin-antitoxin system RelE/ParE family toxin n=1 Tax=Agromyces sp. NPDC056965 TaxID=3345983 RepID=UPI003644684D
MPVFDGYDNVFTMSGPNGRDEAHEFLSTLDKKDQARFQRYLVYLRDGHQVKSPEHMRRLHVKDHRDAEVHELKTHSNGGLRLYVVRWNGKWYLTHGGKKVAERKVTQEAKRALAIFWGD